MESKECCRCKTVKPVSEFWKRARNKDGYGGACKGCETRFYKYERKCSECGTTYTINHRNVKSRKTDLCKECVFKRGAERLAARVKTIQAKEFLISQKGYHYVRDQKEKYGYVLKHRRIMSEHLGRPLERHEVVHHIDGNRLHNEISNLWLSDGSSHAKAHASLEFLGFELVRKGLIVFDRDKGQYRFSDIMVHVV